MARKRSQQPDVPADTNGVATLPEASTTGAVTEPLPLDKPPEQTQPEKPAETNGEPNRPNKTFSLPAGNGVWIEAACWPKVLKFDGQDVTVYSVTVRKSWKDAPSGEWKNSQFFRTSELFLVQYVLKQAEEWVLSMRVQVDPPF